LSQFSYAQKPFKNLGLQLFSSAPGVHKLAALLNYTISMLGGLIVDRWGAAEKLP
jgi:hypothetical protein